jgi:AmmeMemoRadiSam system protein B
MYSSRGKEEMVRQPAVAGQFYPGRPESLELEVSSFIHEVDTQPDAIGAVMPHAGYVYSGAVAGETASLLKIPEKIIILGPNHTGVGADISVHPPGRWLMPFGEIEVDEALAEVIIQGCPTARLDASAHAGEHSIEVQLPFIYYRRGQLPFRMVPVSLALLSLDRCRELGDCLAAAIQESAEPILIISSSDMTHYESHESARAQDSLAIEKILDLDPEGLYETVRENRISMCGVIPTTVMLYAARAMGATGARLVRYATSGETSGDYEHVVGYAGIVVHK